MTSSRTLTTTDSGIYILKGSGVTLTFPASPAVGQQLHVFSNSGSNGFSANGGTIYIAQITFSSLTFSDTGSNGLILVSDGTDWYATYD